MKEFLNKVKEFQKASGQPVNYFPQIILSDKSLLRFNLMEEENNEYFTANTNEDIVEVLDALVDQLYVLLGTINEHGLQTYFEKAFELVHENNMSKVVNGSVIRNESGKILKPEGFVAVDLAKLFKK